MRYEIKGDTLPVVICYLEGGEKMITEGGGMSWMSPNMKMETISGGGMKKMFGRLMSGDSMFQNRFTAEYLYRTRWQRDDCICIVLSWIHQSI